MPFISFRAGSEISDLEPFVRLARDSRTYLAVAARETTGVVQAIESVDAHAFLIGVQWHPEYLPQRAQHRRLFTALVRAALRIAATDTLT